MQQLHPATPSTVELRLPHSLRPSPTGPHAPFGPHPVVGGRYCHQLLNHRVALHPFDPDDHGSAPRLRGARQTSRFTPARASPYPANEIATPLIQLHERVSPHTPLSFSRQPFTHRDDWPTWMQQLHPLPPHQAIYTLSSGLSSPLTAPPPSASMIRSVVPIGGQSTPCDLPMEQCLPSSFTTTCLPTLLHSSRRVRS